MPETIVIPRMTNIIAMSEPGGMVWKWSYQRRRRVERLAKSFCPVRTGRLRNSIKGHYKPAAPQHTIMTVKASTRYARWVHEGTTGPITSNKGVRMGPIAAKGAAVRARKGAKTAGGQKVNYYWVVRGQESEPFLSDALWLVMQDIIRRGRG